MNLRQFILLGNILLSGLILWAGVSIAATWVSKGQKEDSVFSLSSKMSVPKNHTSSKAKRLEDYALITAKDVFHTTKDTAKTVRKDQGEEIKVTELNLELKGTVVGDRKGSYAFIMDKGSRNEEVHYVNDYVMEAQILRIMKGRVILNVEGREEALFMVDESRTLSEMSASEEKPEEKVAPPAFKPGVKRPYSPRAIVPAQRRLLPPRGGGDTEGRP